MKIIGSRIIKIIAMMLLIIHFSVPANMAISAANGDEFWKPGYTLPGLNDSAYALARDGNGNIYVGGSFTSAGGVATGGIARWDGSRWHSLSQFTDGAVIALAIDKNGLVYAGGTFTTIGGVPANGLAVWNGSTWSEVGGGMSDRVLALHYDPDYHQLYVGGSFKNAGNLEVNSIVRRNLGNSTWTALGSGTGGSVRAIAFSPDGTLYVGGDIPSLENVVQWNSGTQTWTKVGNGFNGVVFALQFQGSTLYAGGKFTQSGSAYIYYIARWSGTAWGSLIGGSLNGPVYAMQTLGSTLYVGGEFTTAGSAGVGHLASWNGSNWAAVDAGLNGPVWSILIYSVSTSPMVFRTVLVGGQFGRAGDLSAANIAGKVIGLQWFNFADRTGPGTQLAGLGDQVQALARDSKGNLYAGTCYSSSSMIVNGVLRWDGRQWLSVGSGMSNDIGCIRALAFGPGDILYAGGFFYPEMESTYGQVSRWDGTDWSSVGGKFDSQVLSLAVSQSGMVYAGGMFSWVDGVAVSRVAKWNGSAWSMVGKGIPGTVYKLAIHPQTGDLYAGGYFIETGDGAANRIARFDTSWHALGAGANDSVNSIAFDSLGRVYIAGNFTSPAKRIAYWDGSWRSLGTGVNTGVIQTIAFDGLGRLYAGGAFTSIGGVSAQNVAYWNGSKWSAMGDGVYRKPSGELGPRVIYAMVPDGQYGMMFGGYFSTAGSHVSNNLAVWDTKRTVFLPAVLR